MKKVLITTILLLVSGFIWMSFNRAPLPPTPEISHLMGKEVSLKFKMNKVDYSQVELGLMENGPKGLFIKFSMSDAWKGGRLGLTLDGMNDKSFNIGMPPTVYMKDDKRKSGGGKDFGHFMKDKGGKPVSAYTFKQSVAQGKDGKMYMKMSYVGPDMPMLDMLEIKRNIPVPQHIAGRFQLGKGVTMKPGKVAFDSSINGFWIPVSLE